MDKITAVSEELAIVVKSDGRLTFNRDDAKVAADTYLRTERSGEDWRHQGAELDNYDQYTVRYQRVRNETDKRIAGPDWSTG